MSHSSCYDTNDTFRGILGYGAIGRQCARVAKAFGMDVIVYTLRERSTAEAKKDDSYNVPGTGDPDGLLPSKWFFGNSKESLNHFLAQDIDLLVICLPLTTSTTGLVSKEQFQIMSKRRTFVSNIGRGPIVNTGDLIQALEEDLIRGAAIDVTDPEPLPKEHQLWRTKNIFISPHVSWHSTDLTKRLLGVLELNLERLSEGKPLVNEVDRGLGY
jgi:phosphoglycerate dehydrogenase-like enzyme